MWFAVAAESGEKAGIGKRSGAFPHPILLTCPAIKSTTRPITREEKNCSQKHGNMTVASQVSKLNKIKKE
jgi:hypothetical protein